MVHSHLSAWLQNSAAFTSSFLRQRSALWLVMLLLGLLVLVGHQTLAPIDRDEARFSQASRQMIDTGDFITIKFQDEYRAKKPAGIYWLQSLSAGILGKDEIANYRLPSLAGYLASFCLMIVLARMMNLRGWGGLAPILSALLLASSFIVFAEAHLAKTDSVLLALILWQQIALWDIYRRRFDGQAGAPVNQFWIALAAGVLIKGPIAPLVAAGTVISLCLFDRQINLLRYLRFMRGLLISALIIAPWAVSVQIATQGAFLDIAIKADFLAKVQSGQESHGAPMGTYLLLLPLLAFPASLFMGRLALLGGQIFKRDKGRFAIAWLISYWVMIELTPTKLPHYILPALPALWLLVVMCFTLPEQMTRWRHYLGYALSAIAGIAGLAFALFLGYGALRFGGTGAGEAFFLSLFVILLTSALLYGFWRWMANPQSGLMALLLVLGSFIHMVIIGGVIASSDRLHVSTRLADEIGGLKGKPALIAAAGYHEPSMVFLLGRDTLLISETEAALLLAEADDALAIIEGRKLDAFKQVIQELSLDVKQVGEVSGFNISKGRDVRLYLFRRS